MRRKLYHIALFIVFVMILNSCGGDTTTWAIDQQSGSPIPVCDGDIKTTTNAISVKNGTKISKQRDETVLRIWHFQSGEKRVCVVQGEAIIHE